ncbi:hypothetical protein BT96DRAFT_968600 [Gymnopus androsaceus JB14]|uniref:Reverse transcriptase domain-containing protein n=1 Tax=Gymnopus androsaceus JB14 TaxID=1447944 RepID=A0A6A4GE17_9AGAR|nr:hypothetical protein BT96DRAFT_968600 [Gymnopus androsaceus JB14]
MRVTYQMSSMQDDIVLAGAIISHLEQADDLLILALSPKGLQQKMDLFYTYYGNNFLIINAIKLVIGYHGPPPLWNPKFYFNGVEVEIVDEYTYVGMGFRCGVFRVFSSVFQNYYTAKSKKGLTASHAVLHIESMIGTLPLLEGTILYMGCIDPQLIYGCEVALDTSEALLANLIAVQKSFFRRLLGLSKTAIVVATYTETGIIPLQFRRLELALRFLSYLLGHPASTYVRAALEESLILDSQGKKPWIGDLKNVIAKWCPDFSLPLTDALLNATDSTIMGNFKECCEKAMHAWIDSELTRVVSRTYILKLRKEPSTNGTCMSYKDMCAWSYISDIANVKHQKAFTKLITGDHPLAVVRLTWPDNHQTKIPHHDRLCCFCKTAVETPEHAMLQCMDNTLQIRRDEFFREFYALHTNAIRFTPEMDCIYYLAYLASTKVSFSILAKWIFDDLTIYDNVTVFVPEQYRHSVAPWI